VEGQWSELKKFNPALVNADIPDNATVPLLVIVTSSLCEEKQGQKEAQMERS
jgi:hypothetical protein